MRPQLPILLVVTLVVIAVVNALADINYWYWAMRWFDMPMHFSGGAWLAGFGIWWQYSRRGVDEKNFWNVLGVCLLFALSVGLIWEVYEAVTRFISEGRINDMPDTLSDLLFDILGSIVVAVLYRIKIINKKLS